MRTTDLSVIHAATDPWKEEIVGFDPEVWINIPGNLALTNEYGDVALFERQYLQPSAVCGHYFFHSRGVKACKVAKQFLGEAFSGSYGISTIIGLTPLTKRGALRMNNYLGFQSLGQIETVIGPCELVMLTKEQWENSQ
jgi:hypothetical protein